MDKEEIFEVKIVFTDGSVAFLDFTEQEFWEFKCAMDKQGWFHLVDTDCWQEGEWVNTANIKYIVVEQKDIEEEE